MGLQAAVFFNPRNVLFLTVALVIFVALLDSGVQGCAPHAPARPEENSGEKNHGAHNNKNNKHSGSSSSSASAERASTKNKKNNGTSSAPKKGCLCPPGTSGVIAPVFSDSRAGYAQDKNLTTPAFVCDDPCVGGSGPGTAITVRKWCYSDGGAKNGGKKERSHGDLSFRCKNPADFCLCTYSDIGEFNCYTTKSRGNRVGGGELLTHCEGSAPGNGSSNCQTFFVNAKGQTITDGGSQTFKSNDNDDQPIRFSNPFYLKGLSIGVSCVGCDVLKPQHCDGPMSAIRGSSSKGSNKTKGNKENRSDSSSSSSDESAAAFSSE